MDHNTSSETDFWRHLEEDGAVEPEVIHELREKHVSTWVPLGRIMVERNYLSIRQVGKLIAMQAREPSTRLGNLIVREELCTREEVEDALEEHRRRSPHPIELLMRDGRVRQEDVLDSVVSYVRHLEGRVFLD